MKALRLEGNREMPPAAMHPITTSDPAEAIKRTQMDLRGMDSPDHVAKGLESQMQNLPRDLLESFALEGYRSRKHTRSRFGGFPALARVMQVHGFLNENGVYLNYGRRSCRQDMNALG